MALVIDGTGDITGLTRGAIESTAIGSGAVLQVVQSAPTNSSTTSGTLTTLGSASITPSSTSSKILVIYNTIFSISNVTNAWSGRALYRGSTAIIPYVNNIAWYNISSAQQSWQLPMVYLDSPESNSSVTYNAQFNSAYGQTVSVYQQNFVLMEIAG